MKKSLSFLTITVIAFFQSYIQLAAAIEIETIDKFINVVKLSDRVIIVRTGVTYFDAVTAVSTEKGIVVFDAGYSPTLAAKYKKIIETKFNRKDFAYLINTHAHWDHANGNRAFSDAVIIGHENGKNKILNDFSDKEQFLKRLKGFRDRCVKSLQSTDPNSEDGKQLQCRANIYSTAIDDFERDFRYAIPTITFNDKLSLDMGDVTFHLVYFGKAHSESDILIYIPEANLLMSGDLFNSGGSGNLSRLNHNEVGKVDIDRWYEALNFILQPDNKIEKVIDGHGAILTKTDLLGFYDIVKNLWEDFNSGRKLSAGARLKQVFNKSGLEAMQAEYQEMLCTKNDKYYFYESEFIDIAKHMVGDGKIKAAIEILKINVEKNSESWDAYDNLGELYMLDGNKELAIENYNKSLKFNPDNNNAKEMLKRLGKK